MNNKGAGSDKTKAYLAGPRSPQPSKKKTSGLLTEQQALFCQHYVKTGVASKSALAAGYKKETAAQQGSMLIASNRAVREEIARVRAEVAKTLDYTAVSAMKECEEAMQFAKDTENANAYVKAIELRAKLQGLLVDKMNIQSMGLFSIQIEGITHSAQLLSPPKPELLAITAKDITELPDLPPYEESATNTNEIFEEDEQEVSDEDFLA